MFLFVSLIGPEGVEPWAPPRKAVVGTYKEPALTVELRAVVSNAASRNRTYIVSLKRRVPNHSAIAAISGPRWSRTTAAALSERHASVTTPGRNRGGQNRTALSRAPATTALRGGARRVTITLQPVSQNGRIRTGGLLAPSQADFHALPRSEFQIARQGVEPRLEMAALDR